MSDASTNVEIVKGAYDALASGDVKGFIGVLDPGITVREPECLPYGGTFIGMQEVLGMFGKAGPLLDSGKSVVESIFGDGDRVAAVLRIPLRDGSGEAVMAEHWTLRDGKAVELDVYWRDPTIVT
jgi:ketosteroid isomerase-like protein